MLIEIVPPAQTGDVGDLSAAILEGIDGALSPVGEVLHEEVSQRFETSTDPQGQPWAPLTPKTLIARARKTAGTREKTDDAARRFHAMLSSVSSIVMLPRLAR